MSQLNWSVNRSHSIYDISLGKRSHPKGTGASREISLPSRIKRIASLQFIRYMYITNNRILRWNSGQISSLSFVSSQLCAAEANGRWQRCGINPLSVNTCKWFGGWFNTPTTIIQTELFKAHLIHTPKSFWESYWTRLNSPLVITNCPLRKIVQLGYLGHEHRFLKLLSVHSLWST